MTVSYAPTKAEMIAHHTAGGAIQIQRIPDGSWVDPINPPSALAGPDDIPRFAFRLIHPETA